MSVARWSGSMSATSRSTSSGSAASASVPACSRSASVSCGGVAAGSAVLGRYWQRIKAFFASSAPRERTPEGAPDPSER